MCRVAAHDGSIQTLSFLSQREWLSPRRIAWLSSETFARFASCHAVQMRSHIFRKANETFMPPKANEFDKQYSTSLFRATFGMTSRSH